MREMAQLYQDTLTMADEFQSYFVPEESFETQASDAKNLLNYFFFYIQVIFATLCQMQISKEFLNKCCF